MIDPICEKCLEGDESATHVLCDCEAIAHLRFRQLGQFFTESSDYHKQSSTFHSKCGIGRELIKKRGSTIDQ
jgi:hypothetical protein